MRGFQLIEVILATLVFFLVSIFLLNLLPTSQWAVAKAENRLTAKNLAYSKLEELRGQPFGQLVLGDGPVDTTEIQNVTFSTNFHVSPVSGADQKLVRKVVVTVQWTGRGQARAVEAATYINRIRP